MHGHSHSRVWVHMMCSYDLFRHWIKCNLCPLPTCFTFPDWIHSPNTITAESKSNSPSCNLMHYRPKNLGTKAAHCGWLTPKDQRSTLHQEIIVAYESTSHAWPLPIGILSTDFNSTNLRSLRLILMPNLFQTRLNMISRIFERLG